MGWRLNVRLTMKNNAFPFGKESGERLLGLARRQWGVGDGDVPN